ncbi:peroxiredoxin [Rubritalea spongiae]|uniref:thioredoxin-dependent peroxiredoxin n=1 Tax=Rubritalea spongiae TaxID=430797 RepID=A0ABW5E551_9BACT
MIKKLLRFVVPSSMCASMAFAAPLKVGDQLPEVSCASHEGKKVSLSEFKDSEWVLVYFYPKADTPGCTKQACSLRDSYEVLTDKGVIIFGVSKNTVEEQKAFAEKYKLPFTLLADKDTKVIKAFGVPQFPGIGLAKRQAYLFKEGKLVWKDEKASTTKQAADILKQVTAK